MQMIGYLEGILLGLVQGLTEFLPVSSSAHLVLAQTLLGVKDPQTALFLDVSLHFGTLLSLFLFFWRDIAGIFQSLFRREVKLLLLLVVATLPAVFAGLFLKDAIAPLFVSPKVAGGGLLITGLILWWTRRSEGEDRSPPTYGRALAIGIAQAVAIVPGISRSGSTIATGLFCRLDRKFAVRFSFLMAIPAILGASLLEGFDMIAGRGVIHDPLPIGPLLVGTLTAFVTGLVAISWMIRLVTRGRIHLFAYYCWGIGLLALLLSAP